MVGNMLHTCKILKEIMQLELWERCERSLMAVWYGLTSYSTHFTSFRRRWGYCGISQDCSRSQRWG